MFNLFKVNRPLRLARSLIIPVFLASTFVFASGDGGGGSSGGSGDSGGGDGGGSAAAMDYEKGKKLFYENVVCDSCPYAGLVLENEEVKSVWRDLKKDIKRKGEIGKDLRFSQRMSLRQFIRKRFAL